MILYPNLYCKDVTQITMEILKQNDIKGLILDVDNTLIDYNRNMDKKVELWVDDLKKQGIKFPCYFNITSRFFINSLSLYVII